MSSGLEGLNKDLGRLTDEYIGSNAKDWQHFKYPETVGNDTGVDDINFNSNDASEYAIRRMNHISTTTSEPFILFEFMKIEEDKAVASNAEKTKASKGFWHTVNIQGGQEFVETEQAEEFSGLIISDNNVANSWVDKSIRSVAGMFKDFLHTAKREYIGSCALYMPTDIQINDQMVYNEDTRRIGGLFEAISDGSAGLGDVISPHVLLQPEVMALAATGLGKLSSFSTAGNAITTLASYGIGDIAATELQRSSGKLLNPNELIRYQQTSLRTFTFNWTFLPDSENESNHAASIIKMFRKSAHATKTSAVLITVPDHVVVSFHGAQDMVQIPPCYIESVNVTYNPNVSSFFKKNNAPVEVGLALTLKEIVPIYSDDVEKGY